MSVYSKSIRSSIFLFLKQTVGKTSVHNGLLSKDVVFVSKTMLQGQSEPGWSPSWSGFG